MRSRQSDLIVQYDTTSAAKLKSIQVEQIVFALLVFGGIYCSSVNWLVVFCVFFFYRRLSVCSVPG